MDKQTLEEIKTIIVNEYLNAKDKIFEEEKADLIDNKRAEEKRNKLIGMMTAVESIQREIKKNDFDFRPFKYPTGFIIPDYGVIRYGAIVSRENYIYYVDINNKKGKIIEKVISEVEVDNIMSQHDKIL